MIKQIYTSTILMALILTFMIMGINTGSVTFAATLDQGKSQGFLGETASGYLGLVTPSAPPEMKTLMSEVNKKRKKKYQEIAKRNKTSLKAVEVLAGKTALSKTKVGHFIQLPNGKWKKK